VPTPGGLQGADLFNEKAIRKWKTANLFSEKAAPSVLVTVTLVDHQARVAPRLHQNLTKPLSLK